MEKILKKPVKDFMTRAVLSVDENSPIQNLFRIFDQHGIMGLPVVSDTRKVVGIITESDLLKHLTTLKTPKAINVLGSLLYLDDITHFNENLKKHCAETVKGLMTQPAVTVSQHQTLQELIDLMASTGLHRLPVVDGHGHLVGIVTRRDVVHQMAKLQRV